MVTKLRITHFVVATSDGATFASARDSQNQVRNFLISRYGDIKEQVDRGFEPVRGEDLAPLRKRIDTYYGRVPTYRIKRLSFN